MCVFLARSLTAELWRPRLAPAAFCADATARLSDQVDGQLRTINELNNIVSDHERTICESAQSQSLPHRLLVATLAPATVSYAARSHNPLLAFSQRG
jgi:hypothetical protein